MDTALNYYLHHRGLLSQELLTNSENCKGIYHVSQMTQNDVESIKMLAHEP